MEHTTGSFEGVGGCPLFRQAWLPEGTPRAVVALVHGAGEHCGRYQNLVDGLVPAGYAVAGYDLRGHGRSGGRRGHIDTWEEYRGDLGLFLGLVARQLPAVPVFLYAHSHGSLIALDYILRHPEGLSGAVISGTALEPAEAAPAWQVLLAKTLSGLLPTFSLRVKLEGSSLSRDPQVAGAYEEDPLVHRLRSVRWGAESLEEIEWIRARPGEVRLPLLFLHGEADRLVLASGAERFYAGIDYPDKAIRIYPGGLHEPHNDIQHQQVVSDVRQWLEAHLPKKEGNDACSTTVRDRCHTHIRRGVEDNLPRPREPDL